MDARIDSIINWFNRIYVGGIPQLIRDETAFLSFVCMLAGIEALAGYHNPDASGQGANGDRFRGFVGTYFPESYKIHVSSLWEFRNGMVHGFSPRRFALTHHNSGLHLRQARDGAFILNAEEFYAAFLYAVQKYFAEISLSTQLQANFLRRLEGPSGGTFGVGFIDIINGNPT